MCQLPSLSISHFLNLPFIVYWLLFKTVLCPYNLSL